MTRRTGTKLSAYGRKRQRVRITAKAYKAHVERRPINVCNPPKIFRVIRWLFRSTDGPARWGPWATRHNVKYFASNHYPAVFKNCLAVERAWIVRYGSGAVNYWQHLEYARAEKEGLETHYARFLITEGTKAEGL